MQRAQPPKPEPFGKAHEVDWRFPIQSKDAILPKRAVLPGGPPRG